jgi:hypothetical protein
LQPFTSEESPVAAPAVAQLQAAPALSKAAASV